MADGANVQVSAGVDAAALAQISRELTAAVTAGFSAGFDQLKAQLGRLTSGPIKELSDQMAKAGKGANFSKTTVDVEALGKSFSATTQDSLRLVKAFQDIGAGLTATAAAIDRERSALNRSSIEQNTELSRASNERVATLRNEGKLAAIEAQSQGQLQLREAKTSGQQRVQITREVLDTIGRLEKGFGATIEGIAKTSVGAVGKVFDGLKSAFSRSDKEVFNNTVLKDQLTQRETILRESDKTFNNTSLQTSLNEREREVRSSFEKQTNTIRESVSRQETALAGLRESTQKGVLGQVSNATLLGGLGAGFAALGAIKSTFTIGADFARGLAVLQASLNLTGDDMKKVRQESIDLGNDVKLPGVSALDAAQAIQTLTKQFGALGTAALPAALAAAKATLELSRAARASGEDSAALIGSAVNVFKISANDAVFAADAITGALTRAAGVGFTDFKDSFIQGATVFEQFVGPAENAKNTLLDFNTSLAILAKNGITGANAGAGLKQFFLQASANTKKAIKENALLTKSAGETGTVFFDATGKARPFADSIEILRKGVSGLNDEARHNALAALFGSRSITIANALINSTGVSFGELRAQIAETGLAAKIAAAQNTGLAGAFDALKSVVETVQIILFEKVNKPLGAAVLAITNFANTILFSANPAMHELRIALEGVGIALGVLLGLKAAVEVLALIGKTVALVATPVGALVAVFAILGAGIALFADHTSNFGAQLSHIKDNIVGFGQGLIDKVQPVLTTISNFIQTTAIPAVVGWAKVLGGDLSDAFHTVSDFITGTAVPTVVRWAGVVSRDLKGAFDVTVSFVKDTVIPGFQSFIGVLERDVFSKIAGVAQIVSNAVVTAGSAVAGFAQSIASVVGPLIEPAVKGFQTLGTAISSFFSGGGLGKLGSGFAAAGVGIGSAFANIGSTLLTALKPVGATVLNFFKDAFSLAHLVTALNGVSDFLNFLGEKIGQIATNPKVIAGIAIAAGVIVGVAGKLGLALATGLLAGIGDNLPQLLADAWQLAVKFAFKPQVILDALIVGLAALSISRLSGVFKTLGEGGASGFVSSFRAKISSSGDFFSGLFNGPGNAQAVASGRFFKDTIKQANDLQIKLRSLGSDTTVVLSKSGMDAAKKELDDLSRGLSDAQVKGLVFRDKMRSVGTAIGEAFKGGGQIASGVAQIPLAFGKAGLEAAKALVASIKTGVGNLAALAFGDPTSIGAAGAKTGSTFGQKLKEGLSGAKNSIVGGFQAITAAIQTTAQEQGLTAGQALAKGIQGAAVAAIAIGGGIALGQQIAQAHGGGQTAQAVAGLAATSLAIGAINPIAGIATAGIGLLTAAFGDDGEAARVAKQNIADFSSTLKGDLKDGTIAATKGIIDLNTAIGDANLSSVLGQKLLDSSKAGLDLSDALNQANISFADVNAAFKQGGPGLQRLQDQLISSKLGFFQGSDAASQLRDIYNQLTKSIQNVNADSKFLGSGQKDIATGALAIVHNMTPVIPVLDDVTQSFKNFAGEAARSGTKPAAAAVAVTTNLKKVNDLLGKININAEGGIIPASTPSNVQPAVDVNTALQNILTSKQDIDALFAQGILPPGVSGFQDALNTAILGVQGIGTNIQQAFADAANGPNGEAPKISVDVRAAIDSQQLKTAADNASKVIQAGIAEGVIITPADATKAIQPLVDEATRGVTSDVVKQQIIDAFANVVVTLQPGIDGSALLAQAQDAAANVQAAVNVSIPSKLIPPVPGPTFGADVIAPFAASPIEIPTAVSKPTIPSDWTAAALIAATSGGTSIGAAIDTGVSTGIRGGFRAITDAAKAMADAAIKAAKVNFHIQSPSKVFQQIGQFVVAGLVAGIQEGNGDVVSAITKLVSDAVDAATGAVNDASKALRSGSADLFSALFGSGSTAGKANFGSLQGDITQSFNSLAGALDDSFSKASDVLTQKAAGTLSRAQADLLGESGSSLNVNDVIGSSNRAALTSTIDSIVSLGKAMIDQGVSATQVTQTLQGYIDHTKALAVEYGLNGAQVNDLIDSLGLGTDALSTFVDTTARLATALGQTTTSAKALNDTVVATFKALTNGADAFKSIQGVGLSEDARAKVTSSLNAIASAADQNDQRAKSILDAINAGTALNLSDQLALNQGLNGRSINTTDQFGIANRTAFEQAIGSIRDLGEALLAGGSSAGYVTQQINDQIQALETYAASLGFNTQQIQDLVNEAGLGGASLAAFNQSVADATTIANQAAAAQQIANQAALNSLPAPGSLPANGGATATAPAVLNTLPGHAITINNYLPFGDPDAIALAQANSIATAVRLPV